MVNARRSIVPAASGESHIFLIQLIAYFRDVRIQRNTIYRTDLDTLGGLEMPYTFGAARRVDDVDFFALVNSIVRTFGFANVAVDTFVSDHQRHGDDPQPGL